MSCCCGDDFLQTWMVQDIPNFFTDTGFILDIFPDIPIDGQIDTEEELVKVITNVHVLALVWEQNIELQQLWQGNFTLARPAIVDYIMRNLDNTEVVRNLLFNVIALKLTHLQPHQLNGIIINEEELDLLKPSDDILRTLKD